LIASGPDFLFVDPIKKVKSRASEGRGTHEAISAAISVVENSGITTSATASKVRGAGRRGLSELEGAEGGAAIENGATLLLDLKLKENTLRVKVLKSRYGGAGEAFELTLDRARRRLRCSRRRPPRFSRARTCGPLGSRTGSKQSGTCPAFNISSGTKTRGARTATYARRSGRRPPCSTQAGAPASETLDRRRAVPAVPSQMLANRRDLGTL
jgi:hypothetical protein